MIKIITEYTSTSSIKTKAFSCRKREKLLIDNEKKLKLRARKKENSEDVVLNTLYWPREKVYFFVGEGVFLLDLHFNGRPRSGLLNDNWDSCHFVKKLSEPLFDEYANIVYGQMDLLKKAIHSATKVRDLLLPKLMNGKVTI